MLDLSVAIDRLSDMVNGVIAAIPALLISIVVFIVFYFVSQLVKRGVQRVVRRGKRSDSLAIVLSRLAQWMILLVGFFVALTITLPSLQPGQLVELLGISSVAIGFAFRDILQNFLAGVLLLFTQPFWIGDQIIFNEFEGTVEDINTRATLVRTYDGRRIVIPNTKLFTESVTINTAYRHLRTEYVLGIGYGDDVDLAKGLIVEAINSVPEVVSDPAPTVHVADFGEYSVELAVWWWTDSRRLDVVVVRGKVLAAVKQALTAHGIDLPFPTHQILFHDQTEATDGDRQRQREGWPAGPGDGPEPRGIAGALRGLSANLAHENGREGDHRGQESGHR